MSQQSARPYIGGQAVIEGVMMRSPSSVAIVCRRRSGELIVREQPMPQVKTGMRTWPFVRGVASVVESLRLGTRALRWSAELFERDLQQEDDDAPPPKPPGLLSALALSVVALATQEGEPASPSGGKRGGVSGLLPIVFAVVLFV